MVDFSHLKKLDIEGKTAEYPLDFLPGEPVLIVKSATEANKGYFNAVLRKSRQTIKATKKGFSAKMVKENREDDKNLYPKHIIVGWNDLCEKNGELVEFTEENATNLLAQLPDWIFDDLRTFCGGSQNFTEEQIDVEEKLGNL